MGCNGVIWTHDCVATCAFVYRSTVCGFRANETRSICVSMPVCVHSCTVSKEYTERFNENDTTEYE